MWITSLRVEGLRFAPDVTLSELGRVVALAPAPAGTAVADALSLVAATLSPGRLQREAERLGLPLAQGDHAVLVEDGLLAQVSFVEGGVVRSLLVPDREPLVTIRLKLELDPPLYGQVRTHAMRDPLLALALADEAALHLKIGWLFSRDRSVASVSVFEVRIGAHALPLSGAERPTWLRALLHDVGERMGRLDPTPASSALAQRLLFASLSDDPSRREGMRQLAAALAAPPFAFGKLELVRSEHSVRACLGEALADLRQFGPGATEGLALLEQVLVQRPDVLVVEGLRDPAWLEWLAGYTTGEEATMEQVLVIPAAGQG